MDIITQRLIAIGNRILAELGLLRDGIQQLVRAIHDADEAQHQKQEQQPPVLRAELQIPEAIERGHSRRDDRQYRLQKWLTVGTWCAFVAASIYAGIAALQWHQMKRAARATEKAADAAKSSADMAATQLELVERPWLTFDATISGPLEFDNKGDARFRIGGRIRNTGTSPAVNLRLGTSINAFFLDTAEEDTKLLEQVCSKIEDKTTLWLGGVLFPSEIQPYDIGPLITADQIKKTALQDAMIPQVVVAVFYRPTFLEDSTYCTSRKYVLFKKGHKAIMAGENVPADELELTPDPLSSAYAK